jgi:phage/plasmid-associated DNA primase
MVIATNEPARFGTTSSSDDSFPSRLWCFNFCNRFVRDSSVVEQLSRDIDIYFTVLCEYAKTHYYDRGKCLVQCPEVAAFTKTVCDEQDSVKWWCSVSPFERGGESAFVITTELFERYKDDCAANGRKDVVGRNEFYKRFEDFFDLSGPVQIKYVNEYHVEVKTRGYRTVSLVRENE